MELSRFKPANLQISSVQFSCRTETAAHSRSDPSQVYYAFPIRPTDRRCDSDGVRLDDDVSRGRGSRLSQYQDGDHLFVDDKLYQLQCLLLHWWSVSSSRLHDGLRQQTSLQLLIYFDKSIIT